MLPRQRREGTRKGSADVLRDKAAKKAIVYALLVGGAGVFSLPFLWMVTTSVKVDRELFSPGLDLLPELPRPRLDSPYITTSRVSTGDEKPDPAVLAGLERLVARRCRGIVPEDLPEQDWLAGLALALHAKLLRLLPEEIWDGPPEALIRAADEAAADRVLEDLLARIQRRLCLGQLRVRSSAFEEEELARGLPFSQRLRVLTPKVATLSDMAEKTVPYASVSYDFRNGDRIVLGNTFDIRFDPARLQRVQLYLKPDDTWHELDLTVEAAGVRYRAERTVPLANETWTMVTWQKPGPDDRSTKIRTWVLLREDGRGGDILDAPNQVRVTFEIRRSSLLHACFSKLAMNYIRVLDHIPFWRYVRVSVFLVVTNVVLTVFACSLVAYAFARLNWPGRDFCFLLMLATLMIPGQVTMIPHFLIWKYVGGYNTLTPLWLSRAFGSAFFIFLLRQFLKGIPRDLEDAARIDGCGTLRIYWHLMLPLMKPSLAAIAIFTFMGTWNDFMGPLIYIADQRLYPLAFGLYAFSVQVGNNPALTMAGSLLMTVPVIVIFFFAQKYFIQGVTLTGMKG